MFLYVGRSIASSIVLSCLMLSAVEADVDGQAVLEGLDVSSKEIGKLEDGGVIAYSDKAYESNKRELSADAMILIKTDLDAVERVLTEEATLVPAKAIVDYGIVNSEADFSGVKFTDNEFAEVEKMFNAKAGKGLNFSDAEIALLRERLASHQNSDRAGKIAAASDAMREILVGRYNAYQANGLDGIEPYSRSTRKKIDIGKEIRLTTETFQPFADDFPEFYRVMHDYPAGAECCDHYFRWLKVRIKKRHTFTLAHMMIQKTDDYILATERYYFASNTLNSLQVTLSWLKYDEDTYMGLAMSASTDVLDSMMGRMLRPIGRNMAKDMVSDLMQDVKADLESGAAD
jgi:hypothetical protein